MILRFDTLPFEGVNLIHERLLPTRFVMVYRPIALEVVRRPDLRGPWRPSAWSYPEPPDYGTDSGQAQTDVEQLGIIALLHWILVCWRR
ncbi:MAG TPA: hypothetical protein VF178_12265, partial [Gemmatimonadaceae bacterium]